MNPLKRIVRHARLASGTVIRPRTPPFLILFINSICNQKCEHCFYWRNLNRRDDLTFDELVALSESLGPLENLNLSGGEPFIRKEFAEICKQFVRHNGVKQIYVPTNGWFTEKMVDRIRRTLEEESLQLFVAEFSLDGLGEFHDRFRGLPGSFDRSMASYDALAQLQEEDPRLRIHGISTATHVNTEEIRRLTTYLFERCPQMDHHNLVMIRGDRKNPSLQGPQLDGYTQLYDYMRRLWAEREEGRYGAIADPMLQWAKVAQARAQDQAFPCQAGRLSGVVYSNGDVGVCEQHVPVGNIRDKPFPEIWEQATTEALLDAVSRKQCWCTNETFLWPSITYQPVSMARSMLGAKVWQRVEPMSAAERVRATLGDAEEGQASLESLVQIQSPESRG